MDWVSQPENPSTASDGGRKRFFYWMLALFLAGLCLRSWHLHEPRGIYFDEIYYVHASADYLEGRPDENSVHPPMAKLQMAATRLFLDGLAAYGWNPLPDSVAWRSGPWLAGVVSLGLTGYLAWLLTANRWVACAALGFQALDFLAIVESRITTLDSVQSAWILGALCAAAHYCRRGASRSAAVVCAICLGMATACKWNGLFAVLGAWAAMVVTSESGPKERTGRALRLAALFAFTVAAIYALAYVPLFWREGFRWSSCRTIVAQHQRMLALRYDEQKFRHVYLSPFYEWPFMIRPMWYLREETPEKVRGIVAMGSILVWWPCALFLLESAILVWRRPDPAGQFLVLTCFSLWGGWALSTTGGFIYYLLPNLPLVHIVLARSLYPSRNRWWLKVYLAAVVLWCAAYLPFLLGWEVSRAYYMLMFPLPRWR